jgi:phenylalanyl-tRNA synthetase alpha chain
LTSLIRGLGALSEKEKPRIGRLANETKQSVQRALREREQELKKKLSGSRLQDGLFDVTLPGQRPRVGHRHPVTLTLEEIIGVFAALGFSLEMGPEVETEYYNFDALNIPADHPARDMQDTLYLNSGLVLRTHTSPVQIRVMEKKRPPIRMICAGKVYRADTADASHLPMFHQIEGLMVDREVSFADLKGILNLFVIRYFGPRVKTRFRASFFPFTEPSAEVDISCLVCQGKGCQVCGGSGWLEILGAGMVDPEVFKAVGYDSWKYAGFAFGMGIERITMLRHGINDIRLFVENDMRFLRQF